MRDATSSVSFISLTVIISIHASHAGRDAVGYLDLDTTKFISIHASHAGRDLTPSGRAHAIRDFNPRVPCGTRPAITSITASMSLNFNPRVPCGTRLTLGGSLSFLVISIHASHAGRDESRPFKISRVSYFNPRVPCGTRHCENEAKWHRMMISIHASHAGRDSDMHKFKSLFKTFLVLSQHNFTLLVTKSDFTTNKTMFILYKLGVIIKTASSSH